MKWNGCDIYMVLMKSVICLVDRVCVYKESNI